MQRPDTLPFMQGQPAELYATSRLSNQIGFRQYDRNPSLRIHFLQILISRDGQVSSAIQRGFGDFVILRVSLSGIASRF